jgi:tRNA-specific 2-thiouridylase
MNGTSAYEGLPTGARVVVAMSGGVDSSVTALLLKRTGFDVVGATMQLYDRRDTAAGRTCCAGQDVRDAKRVAESLDVPHYVLDYEKRFEESVIAPFVASYAGGRTPVPCVLCNQTVKFHDLLGLARDLGAAALATGHYVQRIEHAGRVELHRGREAARDQSYFLFATTREQLGFVRFPVGGLPKAEVRRLAAEAGLVVADKPDSQDICFVPSGNYQDVVRQRRPEVARPGEIVDIVGQVLGRHSGTTGYTIGQRRGIGVGGGEALYVVAIDAGANRIVVGPRQTLATDGLELSDVNWLGDAPIRDPLDLTVRIRSTQAPVPATLSSNGVAVKVRFSVAEYGVAPGQACVFYDGTRVLGGGWIRATEMAARAA